MTVPLNVVRRGGGIPLIAIHGNGIDHRLLLPLDECLASAGFWERIYLDLPGFGNTTPLDGIGGLPELADWLVGAIRELVDERPFGLVANSLGGLLARHVAAMHPEQVVGMALIAPVVDPEATRRRRPEKAVVERDDALLASLAPADRDEFTSVAVRQTPQSWEAFRDHALPGIRAADPTAVDRLSRRYFLRDVPEAVAPTFTKPMLLVTGKQDHIVGYEDQFALLTHYPRATYLAMDKAGHNVHLEQPDQVGAALSDWSERVRSAMDDDAVEFRSHV